MKNVLYRFLGPVNEVFQVIVLTISLKDFHLEKILHFRLNLRREHEGKDGQNNFTQEYEPKQIDKLKEVKYMY